MLYSLFEAQHTALVPFRVAAELSRGWFGHPFSPLAYSPLSREIAAGSDLFLRLTQRYDKPAWGIEHTTVDGQTVPVTLEVAEARPFCHLLHFRRELPRPPSTDIAICIAVASASLMLGPVQVLIASNPKCSSASALFVTPLSRKIDH